MMNRLFFKGESPLDKQVKIGDSQFTVIGVQKGDAQRNNTSVRTRTVQVDQSGNELSTARFSRLPDLNASVGDNLSFGCGTSDDNTYKTQTLQTGNFDISASMPIFQDLRINRTIQGSKLDLAAAVQDLERAREDVAVQVMTLYLQVLYNKKLVSIAERQLALSTQQVERSRELVASGKQPESARYESEALVANDALTLTQARNDLQLTLLDTEQSLCKDIEQAGYNAETAGAKYHAAVAALASAETAFSYEEQKAAAGRSTIFDFNDAKTRMEKAASELAQAKFELVFRRKIVDYYHGEPLTLYPPPLKETFYEHAHSIGTTARLPRGRQSDTRSILERISTRMHGTLRTQPIPEQSRFHARPRFRDGGCRKKTRSWDVFES